MSGGQRSNPPVHSAHGQSERSLHGHAFLTRRAGLGWSWCGGGRGGRAIVRPGGGGAGLLAGGTASAGGFVSGGPSPGGGDLGARAGGVSTVVGAPRGGDR